MYSIKNLLTQGPEKITAAAMAVLNVPILLGLWSPDEKAVAGINLALVTVLALFYVGPAVAAVAAQKVEAAKVEATETARNAALADVSSLHRLQFNPEPPAPAKKAPAKKAAPRRGRGDAAVSA